MKIRKDTKMTFYATLSNEVHLKHEHHRPKAVKPVSLRIVDVIIYGFFTQESTSSKYFLSTGKTLDFNKTKAYFVPINLLH